MKRHVHNPCPHHWIPTDISFGNMKIVSGSNPIPMTAYVQYTCDGCGFSFITNFSTTHGQKKLERLKNRGFYMILNRMIRNGELLRSCADQLVANLMSE